MRTSCVKNGLVMVVILLFVGVTVQPVIATVQPEKIIVEPNVDDIEGLVAQLRIAINEKLEKYESIPKVANIWEIILRLLDLIGKITKQFWTIVSYIVALYIASAVIIFYLFQSLFW